MFQRCKVSAIFLRNHIMLMCPKLKGPTVLFFPFYLYVFEIYLEKLILKSPFADYPTNQTDPFNFSPNLLYYSILVIIMRKL